MDCYYNEDNNIRNVDDNKMYLIDEYYLHSCQKDINV